MRAELVALDTNPDGTRNLLLEKTLAGRINRDYVYELELGEK